MSLNTTPRTFVAGEIETAAIFNAEVRDALSGIQAAWSAYTPTLTGITLGNGTLIGRWSRVGKSIMGSVYFAAGSTTTYSATTLAFSLPVAMQAANLVAPGTVRCDNGSNATRFVGDLLPASTTTVDFEFPGLAPATNLIPFTWGTGSKFGATFVYEAA